MLDFNRWLMCRHIIYYIYTLWILTSSKCNCQVLFCSKVREGDKRVVRVAEGDPKGKHVTWPQGYQLRCFWHSRLPFLGWQLISWCSAGLHCGWPLQYRQGRLKPGLVWLKAWSSSQSCDIPHHNHSSSISRYKENDSTTARYFNLPRFHCWLWPKTNNCRAHVLREEVVQSAWVNLLQLIKRTLEEHSDLPVGS